MHRVNENAFNEIPEPLELRRLIPCSSALCLIMNSNRFFWFLISSCWMVLANAQTPTVEWVRAIGGPGNDRSNSITTDTDGNILVVGRFQSDSIRLDSFTLIKSKEDGKEFADAFILKLNSAGKVIWSITAGGFGDDHALSCVTDENGNSYVVGYFESKTLKLGKVLLQNNNCTAGKDSIRYNSDMWVAKFSASGDCIWARNAGGLDGNGQYSTITLDKQNNVIISGIAGGEMNFGNGVKLLRESVGMYVAKYTNDGRLLWVKSPEGKGEAQGVATDREGNVFVAGYFVSAILFDTIPLKTGVEKQGDAFLATYTPEGNIRWAVRFGGSDGEIASCQTDAAGNAYLAGLFFSKNIITEVGTLVNNGSINHFIAKFDPSGKLVWAKSAGGNNGEGPATATREFFVDESGNAFCTGSNWSEFTFAGKPVKSVSGSEDVLLLKYDSNGRERWGIDFGGAGRNAGRGVCSDKNGSVFLTGSFDEKHLKIENYTLENSGSSDVFIVRFSDAKK